MQVDRYLTVRKFARAELEVKKSRFISSVKPVVIEEEARDFIGRIQAEFKDATHNVYAYHVGLQGEIQRMSDDGEPQGTAGPPVLEVIKQEGLTNVAVVVTRFFGGKMLGAGGLIRAYGQAAKMGLLAGQIVERGLFQKVSLTVHYSLFGQVQYHLLQEGYEIEKVDYGADVRLVVFVAAGELEPFAGKMVNLTGNRIDTQNLGQVWR